MSVETEFVSRFVRAILAVVHRSYVVMSVEVFGQASLMFAAKRTLRARIERRFVVFFVDERVQFQVSLALGAVRTFCALVRMYLVATLVRQKMSFQMCLIIALVVARGTFIEHISFLVFTAVFIHV